MHALRRCLVVLSILALTMVPVSVRSAPAPAPPPPPAPPTAPVGAAISCAWPVDPPAEELGQALAALHITPLSGGALIFAGQAIAAAKQAVTEYRCSDALSSLSQAEDRLLAEVGVAEGRALLGELESLVLLCADRNGDAARAARAADRLLMTGVRQPPDIELVMRRYRPGAVNETPPAKAPSGAPAPVAGEKAIPPFRGPGPAEPPQKQAGRAAPQAGRAARSAVAVDTDPPGAALFRDLAPAGTSPAEVPGGDGAADLLDVELPGYRKIHRVLGSGEKISLGLRPEDRLPVLVDAVAAREVGSDEQAAALAQLAQAGQAGLPIGGPGLPRLLLVFAPQQHGGRPASGELLRARAYDLLQKRWAGAVADVPAGTAKQQAQALLAILQGKAGPILAPAAVAAAVVKAPPPQGGGFLGLNFSFSKKKWYNWVIAGGVAALIAGLLIADQLKGNGVTIHAAYPINSQ